jgi:sugar/nucleoside kinase (ribokinase family)
MTNKDEKRHLGLFAGIVTLDIHHLIPEFPSINTKSFSGRIGLYAGGPATNAAVTFAHLGGQARLYTAMGAHPLCDAIRDDLTRCGVELVDLSPDNVEPPPVSSILSTGEDRTVITSPPPPVPDELPEALPQAARLILVDGHLPNLAMAAATQAHSRGITVVLDGGSWKPVHERLLQLVDVAVCSADFHPPGTTTLDDAFGVLEENGIRRCAATRGDRTVVFREDGSNGEIAVPSVRVIDTLGAGDVFHGAFCFALADGMSFQEALRFAAEIASSSCRCFGTRSWMETPE